MDTWMPRLLPIVRTLALALVGFGLLIFFVQRRLAFPGVSRDPMRTGAVAPDDVEQVWLETSYGHVESWLFPGSGEGAGPTILFAHGNGELIDDWYREMSSLAAEGVNVLAVEFPGYGFSEGAPSRRAIREAFNAAFDRMAERADVDRERIVAYGRSLGGGAAGDLARDRPVAALVLQSTFSSMAAVARSMLVPGFLVRDRFDNVEAIRSYEGPVLLMHGPRDDVLPFSHAERLARAREGLEITPIDCAHNDCAKVWPEIRRHLLTLLREHGVLGT